MQRAVEFYSRRTESRETDRQEIVPARLPSEGYAPGGLTSFGDRPPTVTGKNVTRLEFTNTFRAAVRFLCG